VRFKKLGTAELPRGTCNDMPHAASASVTIRDITLQDSINLLFCLTRNVGIWL
jgi:hypothetical protein